MALPKQLVHLNMSGGLQKKDDQFLVIPSKLAVADDAEFDDASTVIMRGGQSSVSLAPLGPYGSFTLGQVERGFAHKGVAYLEGVGTGSVGGVRRVQKSGGTVPVANPQTVSGKNAQLHFRRAGMTTARIGGIDAKGTAAGSGIPLYDGTFDCAVLGNLTCYVWESRDTAGSGRQAVRLVVKDESTGFTVYDALITDGTNICVRPRVLASVAQSKFFIYVASFTSGGTAYSIRGMSVSSVGAVTSLSTVGSDATSGTTEGTAQSEALYDVVFSADATRLGIARRTLTDLEVGSISTTDGVTYTSLGTFGYGGIAPRSLALLITLNGGTYRIHAFVGINTNVIKGQYTDMAAYAPSGSTTVGTAAVGTTVGRIAAYENSSTQILLAYDSLTLTSPMYSSTLRLSSFTHTYGTLTECAGHAPWVIAGRINTMNSRLYLPMAFLSSEYQGTTFVVDLSEVVSNLGTSGAGTPPIVLARIDYGEGAMDVNHWRPVNLPPTLATRGTTFVLPYLKYETDIRIAGTSNDTAICLSSATVDFASQLQQAEINGLTFLSGACPQIFDGSSLVEENFHHAPEIAGSLVAVAAGGTYTLGSATVTVTVCFTWAWQDAQGNWHESAPSGQKSVNITAALPCISPTIISPPTQKANAKLLMYRTKGSSTDTSLYLAVTDAGASVSSDTDLALSEQIYTAGNVLPNTPAPACRHVSLFQKRLVLSGCGDGSRVHWSKQIDSGFGVEFTSGDPTHQTQVPADKGRVVATEEMDDRLVVVCERGVGIIDGQGPNSSGTQGQYSDYRSIITETGASWDSPKSVIRGPEGVWFRSPFGLRLVSRSGSLGLAPDGKQAGAEVDSLVSGTAVAIAGNAKQQIRFYQSSGTCLVWDYQWKQWTRFTGMANVDAVFADGRYYHLSNYSTSTPLLRYTDDSVTVDVNNSGSTGQTYYGYIEIPWLSFAGIQGFERIYRLMVLGSVKGGLPLTNQNVLGFIGYDFDAPSPPSAEAFNASVTSTINNATVQFQHHFAKQKCESVKIGLRFYPDSAGGRLRLTDLTLQVGAKTGYFKIPSSQRF